MSIAIGLVGDYDEHVVAHTAIPRALEYAGSALNINITWSWVETKTIDNDAKNLAEFAAIWTVPGSPT